MVSRFLFVVPPLTGHINPALSVGRELEALGHDIAWVGHAHKLRSALPTDAGLFDLDDLPRGTVEASSEQAAEVRGLSALKFLWQDFLIPLARSMEPAVAAAIESFAPDVVVVDHQAFGGAFAARRAGVPWSSLVTTSASVTERLESLPKVRSWMDAQLLALEAEAGLDPVPEPERSPHLVVVFSTAALAGPTLDFPPHYAFVGPSLTPRPGDIPFPWEQLDPTKQKVLVSLGTVNMERGTRFFRSVYDAFHDSDLQLVVCASDAVAPDPPPNVIRNDFVPQLELLAHMDAVVSHGGHNTVCESLAHGLPLVVTPIRDDQPVVARQVVAAGAGLRLRFGRVQAPALREAVERILHEPSFRQAAALIARSFTAAGGATRAAHLLTGLANNGAPHDRHADPIGMGENGT